MKKVFFTILVLLLISGTAYAVPYTVTDTIATFTDSTVDDYGRGTVSKIDGLSDYVSWSHEYEFDPPAASIISASLAISLTDDNDWWGELAIGWTETGGWDFGEVDTGTYDYDLSIGGLIDGSYQVTIFGLGGDFYVSSSTLEITYDAAPVPEPATMLLLGTGLVGLAVTSRKKIFKKK